ncbi:glycoside hydrolase family 97 protein [Catenovulum sediminis]|uniref:Glycoside hydrolase family 97 protein n=1 Tax=Catenovulum sediminis TaxID=1740262 RepID=A0ABV1RHG5_9ALTE
MTACSNPEQLKKPKLTVIDRANTPLSVSSPDNKIAVLFSITESGEFRYQVQHQQQVIVKKSQLGFEFLQQPALTQFEVIARQQVSYNNSWQAVWGERKNIVEHYNELLISLKDKHSLRLLNLRVRVFNDGIGFRYEFPQQTAMQAFVITDEKTEFNIAQDMQSWWIEADYNSYEKIYQSSQLQQLKHVQTPLTMRAKSGLHLSIHEAALTDYASMSLLRKQGTLLEAELAPWADGTKVKAKVPFNTPWRTIQIAENASQLVESDLIVNLNEPNKLPDSSWIRPMKFIGIWWEIHLGVHTWQEGPRHGATTAHAMAYIDFAAQNNIQAVLFEGWNKGWEKWGTREAYVVPTDDFDLHKVANYAREKNIVIVGHNETGGNIAAYEQHVEEIFSLYNELGINVVKTGYVAEQGFANGENHHGQFAVRHYRKIVELAAKYNIMLNVHEPVKATGIRRTYPNMMTREGARGGEWNAWSEGNSADYSMILPFTRLLAGPMDYTPGIFDIDFSNFSGQRYDWSGNPQNADYRVRTTLARQLANMLVLYSPIQMAADVIENYRAHPAFDFIRQLDVDFDDSQVLAAEVGEYIYIARRSGKTWFIGLATNTQSRTAQLSLDFLKANKRYDAQLFTDAADAHWQTNPELFEIQRREVRVNDVLEVKLAAGGGAAIILQEK